MRGHGKVTPYASGSSSFARRRESAPLIAIHWGRIGVRIGVGLTVAGLAVGDGDVGRGVDAQGHKLDEIVANRALGLDAGDWATAAVTGGVNGATDSAPEEAVHPLGVLLGGNGVGHQRLN